MDLNLNTLIIIIPFFLLILLSNFPSKVSSTNNCSISKCGGSSSSGGALDIRFPFRVKSSPDSCGQPGFDVWCDEKSKDTLIELPRSGNFRVESIDYAAQEMWVNDPNNCLPKRLLSFNLSNSPFAGVYHQDFSFFNCSNALNSTNDINVTHLKGLVGPIKCLSGPHHFMYAIPSNGTKINHTITNFVTPPNCTLVAPLIKVPVQWPPSLHDDTVSTLSSDLHDDLRLSWYMPECRPCELKGQMCALDDTNFNDSEVIIICSNIPTQGMVGKLPLTTFIAVTLVICAPFIICVVVTFIMWVRACCRRRRSNQTSQSESTEDYGPQHINELGQLAEVNVEFARYLVRMGLNEEDTNNQDRRPTIAISEIEEVGLGMGQGSPNSRENENVCAICMVEYRRKDRIGTLPVCGHYFHAICVNKWLLSRGRFGKTCPICRTPVDSS